MTAKDAAAALGVSRQTVMKYCRDGRLRKAEFRVSERGCMWFISKREVERFARSGERPKRGRRKKVGENGKANV